MRKIIFAIFAFTIQISCLFAQEKKDTDTNSICEACKIVHIDSVGNYYVLYAKKTDNKYKILVEKKNNNCRNVVIGQFYNIVLSPPFIETIGCYHNNITHLETGEVIIEKGWGRLYFGFNIEGLCYKDMTLAAVNDSLQKEIEKLQNTSNSNQNQKGKKRKRTDKHGWSKLSKEEMIKRDTMTYYYETNPLIEE